MREIVVTRDGSHTLAIPALKAFYHSLHGAVSESKHVFIEAGIRPLLALPGQEQIGILEVGFGTGLNALLSAIEVENSATSVYYVTLEPFPLSVDEARQFNYCDRLGRTDLQDDFVRMHEGEWNKSLVVTEKMVMHKANHTLQAFEHPTKFNLIYYDAFAPSAQPELWTKEIFEKLYSLLLPGGALVTYCAKGVVRRAMLAAGFVVKKLPGPPGKKQMLRAERE